MEEIKVGEYIRTKEDGICKLIDKEKDADGEWAGYIDRPFWLRENNIVKHSPNIIDLIEVGDYVNGELVASVSEESVEIGEGWHVQVKNIKSIVTHEQFNSIKYEVI